MKIILNPTHEDHISLEVEGKISKFPHTKRDSGSGIIRRLAKLGISKKDELNVVTGPGNFSAIRAVCLIGNAVKFLTKCKIHARKKSEKYFREVKILQPFYSRPPAITTPKK